MKSVKLEDTGLDRNKLSALIREGMNLEDRESHKFYSPLSADAIFMSEDANTIIVFFLGKGEYMYISHITRKDSSHEFSTETCLYHFVVHESGLTRMTIGAKIKI